MAMLSMLSKIKVLSEQRPKWWEGWSPVAVGGRAFLAEVTAGTKALGKECLW